MELIGMVNEMMQEELLAQEKARQFWINSSYSEGFEAYKYHKDRVEALNEIERIIFEKLG